MNLVLIATVVLGITSACASSTERSEPLVLNSAASGLLVTFTVSDGAHGRMVADPAAFSARGELRLDVTASDGRGRDDSAPLILDASSKSEAETRDDGRGGVACYLGDKQVGSGVVSTAVGPDGEQVFGQFKYTNGTMVQVSIISSGAFAAAGQGSLLMSSLWMIGNPTQSPKPAPKPKPDGCADFNEGCHNSAKAACEYGVASFTAFCMFGGSITYCSYKCNPKPKDK